MTPYRVILISLVLNAPRRENSLDQPTFIQRYVRPAKPTRRGLSPPSQTPASVSQHSPVVNPNLSISVSLIMVSNVINTQVKAPKARTFLFFAVHLWHLAKI